MKIEELVEVVSELSCRFRLKLLVDPSPESWGQMLISPVEGYVEINGPWPLREVEWIEIDPVVEEYIGRLIKPRVIDYSAMISVRLHKQEINFFLTDGIIRVPVSE